MKIVIAPDSFKGNIRSPEICEIISKGIWAEVPDAEVITVPMADGGEGTTEAAVLSTQGSFRKATVTGPNGKAVEAEFGILGNSEIAVMEMAAASGIELLPAAELNPMKTTTYGTGELLKAVLDIGCREIIIGIGGSATVDGGIGMLRALGYNFLDKQGNELSDRLEDLRRLESIDSKNVDPRLKDTVIKVACDVTNPLLGANGAPVVFGPQKGASPEMVEQLEEILGHYSRILVRDGWCTGTDSPGDGAAGGLGLALRVFCQAEILSGAGLMIETAGLKQKLAGADLLITGEGRTDSQTSSGKLCAVIADTARALNVPVVVLSGALKIENANFPESFTGAFSICNGPCSLEQALADSKENLLFCSRNIARLIASFQN
jgi:glycerate kinase